MDQQRAEKYLSRLFPLVGALCATICISFGIAQYHWRDVLDTCGTYRGTLYEDPKCGCILCECNLPYRVVWNLFPFPSLLQLAVVQRRTSLEDILQCVTGPFMVPCYPFSSVSSLVASICTASVAESRPSDKRPVQYVIDPIKWLSWQRNPRTHSMTFPRIIGCP